MSAIGGLGPAPAAPDPVHASPSFAHQSEAELARILDFYEVRWQYEPHVFPILWNLEGDVLESFSPDFYLPDLDLYVELTTLKQRLVRKKNRKLRRLRELYPDVRIKLFYARDFRMLMLKYGQLGLLGALSGTPGQVVPPPRPHGDAPAAPAAADTAGAEDPGRTDAPSSAERPTAGAAGRRLRRRSSEPAAPIETAVHEP